MLARGGTQTTVVLAVTIVHGAWSRALSVGSGTIHHKTIPIDSLEHARSALPAGVLAGNVKLGAMKAATVKRVLAHPEAWPLEVVDRAIQQAAAQLSKLPSVGELAERNRWFDPADDY